MSTADPDRPPESGTADPVARILDDVAGHLRDTALPLQVARVEDARDAVRAAGSQLSDYIVPRYASLEAPLLAVVGGSTGAGKSTLVNAIAGHPVTRTGAIRPTTRQPILVHHPADAGWFHGTRVLPGLSRIRGALRRDGDVPVPDPAADRVEEAVTSLVLVGDDRIAQGIALLDAPDIDSVSDHNRALASQLLAAADLWIFVTTANRYADAVPWRLLRSAAARDILVTIVLDRIPPAAGVAEEISEDLRAMLEREGLGEARLFTVPEAPLNEVGMLDAAHVAALRAFLIELAADAQQRAAVARRTLAGAVRALAGTVAAVAAAADAQTAERERLAAEVSTHHTAAIERIMETTRDGTLLRGEVLSRWQDFVGTGDIVRSLESGIGRVRDRIGAFLRGEPAPAVKVEAAIESDLAHVIVEETAKAAERSDDRWRHDPAGRALLAADDLSRLPRSYEDDVARQIRAWQGDLMELVRTEGQDKRTTARIMSFGVNALAVVLMIVVFASTAFIPTGAEVGVGAGTAIVGQKILEAIFGDDAVRRLARIARQRLEDRVTALLRGRERVFTDRLQILGPAADGAALHADAAALERAAATLRAAESA